MANPFLGEIRMFAGSFAPAGWALCNGQPMSISENDALFTLIGTTYGGDGQETFNLPNLQSRVPMHIGNGVVLGEAGGVESVTLTVNQSPAHSHPLLGSTALGSNTNPQNAVLAQDNIAGADLYIEDTPTANMAATAIVPVGGSQPHENMQPYLVINFIISLFGVFPPAN
jgi:microcystin-dependent protein